MTRDATVKRKLERRLRRQGVSQADSKTVTAVLAPWQRKALLRKPIITRLKEVFA